MVGVSCIIFMKCRDKYNRLSTVHCVQLYMRGCGGTDRSDGIVTLLWDRLGHCDVM